MLSYYVSIDGPATADAALLAWFKADILKTATGLPGAAAVRVFQPAAGNLAFFKDEGTPRLLIQVLLEFALDNAGTLAKITGKLAEQSIAGCNINHQLFELVEEPLPGAGMLSYGNARLSFAVRYYADDDEKTVDIFRQAYLEGHPPVLAGFPGVRRVFCYLPVAWNDPSGIKSSNSIIGNEVVFDSLESLNVALNSPIMDEVKGHSRGMPRINGSNTHFPMLLAGEWIN